MPKGSLIQLLKFLREREIEPLERASSIRPSQRFFALIFLLATGRRKSELANLCRIARVASSRSSLDLVWIPVFALSSSLQF